MCGFMRDRRLLIGPSIKKGGLACGEGDWELCLICEEFDSGMHRQQHGKP